MKRYLTPIRDAAAAETVRRVPIDEPVGVYRRDDGSHAVVAETTDEVVELGIRDAAVSRKHDGRAPVELASDRRGVRVRNAGSKNPVSVRTNLGEQRLATDEETVVTGDCVIELGITTEIRASVERDRDTLSRDELAEMLAMEADGDAVEGVSPAIHAQMTATALRKAGDESVTECRKVITELRNFVAEHQVDDPDYEDVVDTVDRVERRLENASDNRLLDGDSLDEERKEDLDLLADRVEKLYGRSG